VAYALIVNNLHIYCLIRIKCRFTFFFYALTTPESELCLIATGADSDFVAAADIDGENFAVDIVTAKLVRGCFLDKQL